MYDLVVYGGTPAGIIAAYEAAVSGKSVLLIESSQHMGGMMTGGLSASDYHDPSSVGGRALEFFYRVCKEYQLTPRSPNGKFGSLRSGESSKFIFPQWDFEPHVAENVFNQMLQESHVTCVLGQRLDRVGSRGIFKQANHIVSITMETGEVYQGKIFIDATYEGDLMALAGVPYSLGRESNQMYNESFNGIQPHSEYRGLVDPYVVAGDPTSGLLPGIDPVSPGNFGDGDNRVQAFNFRLCMTQDPDNRISVSKPDNYDPKDYELLARLIAKSPNETLGGIILKFAPLPNNKADANSAYQFSSDLVSMMSSAWPEASYAERDAMFKRYADYTKGLLWFAANDNRVPFSLRQQASEWGLAADEFIDNGNMPYRLYIREARRMRGMYTMTEHNVMGDIFVSDPIALGCYGIDSHTVSVYLDSDGLLNIEGGTWGQGIDYGISYRSLVPQPEDCDNLIVPICISATHAAFDSLRMEPVYMSMGHAAGTAACLAIDNATNVQSVDYTELSTHLANEGQVFIDPDRLADLSIR